MVIRTLDFCRTFAQNILTSRWTRKPLASNSILRRRRFTEPYKQATKHLNEKIHPDNTNDPFMLHFVRTDSLVF